ncbi:hypothetical protein [Salisediminibacterium halotolerans]|uniref:Uncharacterized protein n=1 Tax=Salisediminibacterium halotolerans TaxID=517425 RepID=A0A1H9VFR8_9BACI|nr:MULTISPECIES: hypothetical protein [Salisediminibacterium]RLJ74481.1 hypothetical protein BCL39_1771 [Actinophytocola xinjiangensis]RPE87426.1 hypothetical protein EDD67_1160 [Salisediminibacterium halotolerans]TWG35317.1 hypothetical protein BCL52_1768 [Salisediminibacterium halotolerans]SES20640.1 hypothetical protein SAMN05444126_12049 [Salisediminibacterium haloalkalitolerans]GEL07949.1 hypothetical protein SHA02_13650 [Salisediminibacterium halotolerans]
MRDEHRTEEKIEKRKEPGKVGATFIKYGFITLITLIILFFIANYLLPMIPGGGDGAVNNSASGVEIEQPIDEEPISA